MTDKKVKKPNLDIIKRYLQVWDPIDLMEDWVASGNLLDEYDHYADEIHELLESGIDVDALVNHLARIQREYLGLQEPNLVRDRIFASGLIRCFQEFSKHFY